MITVLGKLEYIRQALERAESNHRQCVEDFTAGQNGAAHRNSIAFEGDMNNARLALYDTYKLVGGK